MNLSDPTTQAVLGGLIRSVLILMGADGIFSGNQLGIIAGAAAALIGVAWSVWKNKTAASKAHARIEVAVKATAENPQNAATIIAAARKGEF